jgi:ParB family chromosome partitioning protein
MAKRIARPASSMTGRDLLFGTSPDLPKVVEVSLADIRANPDQPRRTIVEEGIRELASSIESHGLLQPVTVRKDPEGGYLLVAGERRLRAHRLLGRETIAAIVTRGNPDELSLIENIQREDLAPLEEAAAMARMMERHGYTQEELARAVGKARPTVTKLLKLNALPDVIKAECATSHITGTDDSRTAHVPRSVLLEIVHLPTVEEQLAAWQQVRDGGATVRALRAAKDRPPVARDGTVDGNGDPRSRLAGPVAACRSFLKRMRRLPPHEAVADPGYEELRRLKREIDEVLDACERARTVLE